MAVDSVGDLLLQNIPRDLVMGIEDALNSGARGAFSCSKGMHAGHAASVIGQMRHFHMNERFHEALTAADACPTPLRGNAIVAGRCGIFALGRFNISRGMWNHCSRSRARQRMAQENRWIEALIQPELFGMPAPITSGAVFFVAEFSGSLTQSPDVPLTINIAVPDRSMQQWLFWEPVNSFLARYSSVPAQADLAVPTLKADINSKMKKGGDAG